MFTQTVVIFVAVILLGAGVLVNLLIGESRPFTSPTTAVCWPLYPTFAVNSKLEACSSFSCVLGFR